MSDSSEEHRHNCEVKYCMSMPLQDRRKFLSLVEEKRGLQERKRLEASLYKLWEQNRGQNS